ncbi:MAG: hypothetical protein ACOC5M_03185 [Chloroflexota bacterium]
MYTDNEPPFWALVGNSGLALWADAAVGYITFYHLFFKGVPLRRCVDAMKVASADQNFMAHLGHETRQNWAAFVQQHVPSLDQAIQQATNRLQNEEAPR